MTTPIEYRYAGIIFIIGGVVYAGVDKFFGLLMIIIGCILGLYGEIKTDQVMKNGK